jgi:hypothetical protein
MHFPSLAWRAWQVWLEFGGKKFLKFEDSSCQMGEF